MARPVRVEYEGAVYHVMARGQERGSIYRDDEDRHRFLKYLETVTQERQWAVHAYCLMTNHYHLLIETPNANLCAGMRDLNGLYSQAFNLRHGRKGHVLEDRYKAIVVEKEAYLLELSRYVVLNPVRAGMVASASEYRWSNYRATAGKAERPEFLAVAWTLERFGGESKKAREAYELFVAEGSGAGSPMDAVTAQVFLGSAAFLAKMRARLEETEIGSEIPREQRRAGFIALGDVVQAVASEWGVSEGDLREAWGRRESEARVVAVYLARRLTGMSGVELGKHFGVTSARVGQLAKKAAASEETKLRRRIAKVHDRLCGER